MPFRNTCAASSLANDGPTSRQTANWSFVQPGIDAIVKRARACLWVMSVFSIAPRKAAFSLVVMARGAFGVVSVFASFFGFTSEESSKLPVHLWESVQGSIESHTMRLASYSFRSTVNLSPCAFFKASMACFVVSIQHSEPLG